MARIWGRRRRRGCAPPHPLLFWGLRPPDPPKGAPRPWLQRLLAFSRPSHLSGAAALPGAKLFLRIPTFFLNKPLVPGSFVARGRTFYQISDFFGRIHLSWAASLPGADFFSEIRHVFEQATCPGQLRCLGQNFFQKINVFRRSHLSRAASLPGAEHFFFQKFTFFEETTCPGQLRCLGQNVFQKVVYFFFEEATCPGQLRCLGQIFPENLLF